MPVVVGVDAGGSSTRAIASRDGSEGTVALEGSANVRRVGVGAAAATVARAAARALEGAHPGALHVGISGGGAAATREALERALKDLFPQTLVSVSDDVTIALRAGVANGDALALIAGTGSIACADIAGVQYRAGGYGYLIGDEGSATAIGTAALNLTLRCCDGRVPTEALFKRIQDHLGANGVQSLLDRVYVDPEPLRVIAGLAPLVLAAATAGERSATKVVQGAALGLFELVRTVARAAGVGDRDLPLVLAGGIFETNSVLTFLLETRISNELPNVAVLKGVPIPVYGALAIARALAAS
jgi:N-acetylglucosamine kinase-like BadF-type ATPase